jgi:DNA-directed RNA polymerase specialized sigma24 family protein
MTDRVLVDALRADDPDALADLYDAYAEGIHRYCWSLLRSSDSAQVALRDTLIAARAHIDALADPDRLRPWLYALARGECLRRRLSVPGPLDPIPDAEGRPDADLRVIAWNALQSLPAHDRELLDLVLGHGLTADEAATVLSLTPRQIESAAEEARGRLRDAATAEQLARKGPYCPGRARAMTGFTGELTADLRARLVRHGAQCDDCAPWAEHTAERLFELLPALDPPEELRVRVLSCFADPELAPYRRYVAGRSGALDGAGFPGPGEQAVRGWPQAVVGALAAMATAAAVGVIFQQFGTEHTGLAGVLSGPLPVTGVPPAFRPPWQLRQNSAAPGDPDRPNPGDPHSSAGPNPGDPHPTAGPNPGYPNPGYPHPTAGPLPGFPHPTVAPRAIDPVGRPVPSASGPTRPVLTTPPAPPAPTEADPDEAPTGRPGEDPHENPGDRPTRDPQSRPTRDPHSRPTRTPTAQPTRPPTERPTRPPTGGPTGPPATPAPTRPAPTPEPTPRPTTQPGTQPTTQPTTQPGTQPTAQPATATQPAGPGAARTAPTAG